MATKEFAMLALAGAAYAHMGLNSSTLNFATSAPSNSNTIIAAVPSSPVSITTPSMMAVAGTGSGPHTRPSIGTADLSTSADDKSSWIITIAVGPSATTSALAPANSNETGPVTTLSVGNAGTGGMSTPNVNATTAVHPFPGSGDVSGVSIGLFAVSVLLTALLQL